jgi:hypothetical protein
MATKGSGVMHPVVDPAGAGLGGGGGVLAGGIIPGGSQPPL